MDSGSAERRCSFTARTHGLSIYSVHHTAATQQRARRQADHQGAVSYHARRAPPVSMTHLPLVHHLGVHI